MLEDPSYENIVRWGEGGESFVVLEVGGTSERPNPLQLLTFLSEREIYQVHSSKTFQA
jgi:hypothetical protein